MGGFRCVSVNADEGRGGSPFLSIIAPVTSIYEGDRGMTGSQNQGQTQSPPAFLPWTLPGADFPEPVAVAQFRLSVTVAADQTPALVLLKICTLTEKTPVLSLDGPPHVLCCRASLPPPPPPHHLLNRLFSCFCIAVFYYFGPFYLM